MQKSFHRTDRPVCPGQATSDAARRRAGWPGRDASGGLRGVSPQDDIPKSSAHGAARSVPRRRGPRSPVYTSVRTLTNRARPSPQNFAPPRSWTGSSTHGRVYVRSPCSDSRGARRAMTTARRSPASQLCTACDFRAGEISACSARHPVHGGVARSQRRAGRSRRTCGETANADVPRCSSCRSSRGICGDHPALPVSRPPATSVVDQTHAAPAAATGDLT